MSWQTRPEHIYVGPRRCGKSTIVAGLREAGFFAHECTTETGAEILHIYSTQRKVHEADPSAKTQPRLFFSDQDWWQYGTRFHYVGAHLRTEIAFPEAELEALLPHRSIDWLYLHGADARDRLIPELAVVADARGPAGNAEFMEKVYPDLVPALVYAIPEYTRLPASYTIRMPRTAFESRVRSYKANGYPLPHKLTTYNLIEYLLAVGIAEHTNKFYLRIAPAYASGLIYLKKDLTHKAINARFKERKVGDP